MMVTGIGNPAFFLLPPSLVQSPSNRAFVEPLPFSGRSRRWGADIMPGSAAASLSSSSPSLRRRQPPQGRMASESFPLLSSSSSLSFAEAGPAAEWNPELSELDSFLAVAHEAADAAGHILCRYFRQPFDILDKADHSPVTIADKGAEEAMRVIISKHFPNHAIFGEEFGLSTSELSSDYIWVLDPIDGTKSFITGKPVFGTLISLVHKGTPVIGIIDQPILKERWVGVKGRVTTVNGKDISVRQCGSLASAYFYTTSPHLFSGDRETAFTRVRNKVKVPLYGCDCYAYGLLAMGHVDLVIESGLKPYDLLALVPVVSGAGGIMTGWRGECLQWWPSSDGTVSDCEVIAAGDLRVYKEAMETLAWN